MREAKITTCTLRHDTAEQRTLMRERIRLSSHTQDARCGHCQAWKPVLYFYWWVQDNQINTPHPRIFGPKVLTGYCQIKCWEQAS